MLIEIFADFSCPWCFVGRRRLGRARAQRPQLSTEIVWQPFQLNPDLPIEGVDRTAYLRAKFGDRERMQTMEIALEESGAKEGIRFAFHRIRRIPNTLAAHRLMRFASEWRRSEALADRLFTAYFEAGEDIGDPDLLADQAALAGLDRDAAAEFLASGRDRDMVMASDELARQGGVSGVPYFVFDRRYALAGAQEPAAFLPLFDALTATEPEMISSP